MQEEYEDEDVNVKIVELSSDTLQKKDLVIGQNKPKEATVKEVVPQKKEISKPEITGMGSDEESNDGESETVEKDDNNLKTKKELKKMLKKQATKKIQKSKAFQMKSKLDRIKNKKKSQQKKGQQGRLHPGKDKSKSKSKSNAAKKGVRRKH